MSDSVVMRHAARFAIRREAHRVFTMLGEVRAALPIEAPEEVRQAVYLAQDAAREWVALLRQGP